MGERALGEGAVEEFEKEVAEDKDYLIPQKQKSAKSAKSEPSSRWVPKRRIAIPDSYEVNGVIAVKESDPNKYMDRVQTKIEQKATRAIVEKLQLKKDSVV